MLIISKHVRLSPDEIKSKITIHFSESDLIEIVDFKNNFINFVIKNEMLNLYLRTYAEKGFEKSNPPLKYNIEFVSANPTGYLHLAHARHAALGDSLSRIIKEAGNIVEKEFYINDLGNQINNLTASVVIRYLNICGIEKPLLDECYKGKEIIEVAQKIYEEFGDKYTNVRMDEYRILDKDIYLFFRDYSTSFMLEKFKEHLSSISTSFDLWTSESEVMKKIVVVNFLKKLHKQTYESEGALWLKTTEFGDDKDRVIKKSDGSYTYFLPDIIFHDFKFSRGYDKLILILGADHFGYNSRLKAAMEFLGHGGKNLDIITLQIVKVLKDNVEVKMSKRSGVSITLIDLVEEIGSDALRWFMVCQSPNTHLTIDINLATSKSNENPVYYVQYCNARINQIMAKSSGKFNAKHENSLLIQEKEKNLFTNVLSFDNLIEVITKNNEVHRLCNYLLQLSRDFHSYYAEFKILEESNVDLSNQRLWLCELVKITIKKGLNLLGISSPDQM
jgi:arginyl-tRNA synthetase